jgi:hypothetical protein
MTTHEIIFRDGKRWFAQHHTGHPDYTGKLLLAIKKKYGEIKPHHVKLYFDPCQQDSAEYEYDIRKDGIYYRNSDTCMTIKLEGNILRRASKSEEDAGKKWRKLTPRATGSLADFEEFLRENTHLRLRKDNPRLEQKLGLPPSKYPIGTRIKDYEQTFTIVTKHIDSLTSGWYYDTETGLCISEQHITVAKQLRTASKKKVT